MSFLDRLEHAWNAFFGKGPPYNINAIPKQPNYIDLGFSSSYRPDRVYFTRGQEKTFVNTIINRIAIDVASFDIRHVRLDDSDRFLEEINDDLNNCLRIESNKDQTGRAFIQDIVMSMLDEGCVAVVPIDTDINPKDSTSYNIETMRVGKILQWYPDYIEVECYNDKIGQRQTITVPKNRTAIIENPFYAIMNEPNSILQRLIKKLNLLDVIDAQSGSGKLNLIIQLPYVIKTTTRREQAEKRRADIESQLATSQYGIAYTDGTEKITQLNRPAENNLLTQVQYLTSMLFSQLGLTDSILNGTADERTMLNYQNRIIVPILNAITEEFRRKFLTKTARTQKQSITYFTAPFKYVNAAGIADLADKMTRNEIMTSNEIRQLIGLKPAADPNADALRNKNLNASGEVQSISNEDRSDSENAPSGEQQTLLDLINQGGRENQNE